MQLQANNQAQPDCMFSNSSSSSKGVAYIFHKQKHAARSENLSPARHFSRYAESGAIKLRGKIGWRGSYGIARFCRLELVSVGVTAWLGFVGAKQVIPQIEAGMNNVGE